MDDLREEEQGGRIFFSNVGRSMEAEDEIELTSVGIDIGSATSHLVFSKIVLERLDTRYMVVERTLLHQSDVLLTPYSADETIDADALGQFISEQYVKAGLKAEEIDTGALILTGVAVRRRNARAIGELFAAQGGKFVVVSAGDGLEATLAAHGSGAVSRSGLSGGQKVLNIDIGGGTSKLAFCEGSALRHVTALDVGARVLATDAEGRIVRIEDAGRHFAELAGIEVALGTVLDKEAEQAIVGKMVDALLDAVMGGTASQSLHRLPGLPEGLMPDVVTVSGGVSEFFYDHSTESYGDLGQSLAKALRARLADWPVRIEEPDQGIRATVVGASQYTVQVSGSTIFVRPLSLLPMRNLPVIRPELTLGVEIDPEAVAAAIEAALVRLDLDTAETPVALFYQWSGSATYHRLDGFCRGVQLGLGRHLANGHPLVLVANTDIGGLVGMHCLETLGLRQVASIDGIELDEFDFIDIGAILETSGAVPVVVKSLIFPTQGLGRTALDQG